MKYVVGGFGILLLVGIIIIMPKFQAVREVEIAESVSNVYSVIHGYERSQISNRETMKSLLINSSIDLGSKEGGLELERDSQIGEDRKEELKNNFVEDLKKKIESNGGKNSFFDTIQFKDGYISTSIVKAEEDFRTLYVDLERGNVSILLESYCPTTVGSGHVSQVHFENKYKLEVGMPVRYLETYEKAIDFLKLLREDYDSGNMDFDRIKNDFNRDNREDNFSVILSKGKNPLIFSILDERNNVTYSKKYGPFMFNVSVKISGMPKACIVVGEDCERRKECILSSKENYEIMKWKSEGIDIKEDNRESLVIDVPEKDEFTITLTVKNDLGEDIAVLNFPGREGNLKDEYGSCS